MNVAVPDIKNKARKSQDDRILKLAIFAVGGQGGGVLNSWIISMAEAADFHVQATSVAGVAQRTGSTIYYLELLGKSDAQPVFALAPTEGDVDILLSAEIMEAGRAVQRGFASPTQTTVITSTHRQFATQEKVVPGDGTQTATPVIEALRQHAETVVAFDMQSIAEEEGTVISASLFGALAGSRVLPFPTDSFRETLKASKRGVEKSLAAFERAYAIASGKASETKSEAEINHDSLEGPESDLIIWNELDARIANLPANVQPIARAGLRKTTAFQDLAYGEEYLNRVFAAFEADNAAGGCEKSHAFTENAAKYLANAMAYDDVIRVAAAKTEPDRLDRIAEEVGAGPSHLTRITEYTHPGVAEVVSMLPNQIGEWVESKTRLMRTIDWAVNRGRHIRTDTLVGFLQLYVVAGLRSRRRGMLRHCREVAHLEEWIFCATNRLTTNYDFAVQTLKVRRLIKGYSDTHARGLSKFDRVMEGARLVETRMDAADWLCRLINAALAEPGTDQLDGAIATIRSFAAEEMRATE